MSSRTVAFAIVCAACGSDAATPTQPPPSLEARQALAVQACPVVTKPFLYSIEKDGKTSYILGTRHTGVSLAQFPAFVQTRFRAAKTVVVESISDVDLMKPMAASAADELGDTLWNKFKGMVGAERAAWAEHRGPVAIVGSLTVLWEDNSKRVDAEIEREAKASDKHLIGLEDDKQTQDVADEILGIEPAKAMVNAISGADELRSVAETGLRKYCAGEVQPPGYGHLASSTAKRNQTWLPKLDALLADGDVFIAVGVDHIAFGHGLVDMLRDAHYDVRRVRE